MTHRPQGAGSDVRSDLGLMMDRVLDGQRSGTSPDIPARFSRYMWCRREVRFLLMLTLVVFIGVAACAGIAGSIFTSSTGPALRALGWLAVVGGSVLGLIGLVLVGLLLYIGVRVKQMFRHAVLTPGVIVSTEPLEFVSLANLNTGIGLDRYALKRLRITRLPQHEIVEGARIPCASTFRKVVDMWRWEDFEPEPLSYFTGNRMVLEDREARIPEEAFRRLEACVRRGEIPDASGDLLLLEPEETTRTAQRRDEIVHAMIAEAKKEVGEGGAPSSSES